MLKSYKDVNSSMDQQQNSRNVIIRSLTLLLAGPAQSRSLESHRFSRPQKDANNKGVES